MQTLFTLLVLGQLGFVASQAPLNNTLPNTFPHAYPGLPNDNANFSDAQAWQNCKPSFTVEIINDPERTPRFYCQ